MNHSRSQSGNHSRSQSGNHSGSQSGITRGVSRESFEESVRESLVELDKQSRRESVKGSLAELDKQSLRESVKGSLGREGGVSQKITRGLSHRVISRQSEHFLTSLV